MLPSFGLCEAVVRKSLRKQLIFQNHPVPTITFDSSTRNDTSPHCRHTQAEDKFIKEINLSCRAEVASESQGVVPHDP